MTDPTAHGIAALSAWIDGANTHRDPEAQTWSRIGKITEEAGEAIAAFIGMTGQNPRKGITHARADVEDELLDVAITALAALEHLRGHDEQCLVLLARKVEQTLARADLGPQGP
ncbi:MazG-like family protein [Brachybacterium hainanense]|uniref:MazG-like family protein n=1 Tax=Brachybacterium hainanense TaxID=1541174 RepID=A0ABV6RG92_9MICO